MTGVRDRVAALNLPSLGLGGAPFANMYTTATDEDAAAVVDAAWDGGIRYFDTAPHYGLGLGERRLGAALAGRPRDEYLLSTKVGRLLVPNPEGEGQQDESFAMPATLRRQWDFSRDGVLRSFEASLERLGVDRVDLVLLHDPDAHWEEASTAGVGALVELRDQGVVRAIGAGMNQSAMLTRFVRETDIDVVLCAGRFTLLEQGALDDLLPAALERGVAVIAGGVYNSGLTSVDRPRDDATYDYGPAPQEMIDRARRIAAVCEAHGLSLPAVATGFPRRHPAVVTTLLGLRSPAEVAEAFRRLATEVPDALWQDLADQGLLRKEMV
jgi:D-threo-aldose 1-dehydrogenase